MCANNRENVRKHSNQKFRKTITDKLAKPDGKPPNNFNELYHACRRNSLKNLKKIGKSSMGMSFGRSMTSFGDPELARRRL